jgi:hypothetical protein
MTRKQGERVFSRALPSLVFALLSWALSASSEPAPTGGRAPDFTAMAGAAYISDYLEVYGVDKEKRYLVNGEERRIGGAFQPSVVLDAKGRIHIFFQARLDSSDDRSEKMIAHVTSENGGATFSEPRFVNPRPMQTYAISAFLRRSETGGERISLLTSVSIDETVTRHKDAGFIKETLGIDLQRFTRKAATLILEYYSDDGGVSWTRKEHWNIADRVYSRNGREFYLTFINLIGQVRRIDAGPFAGRLILAGPIRGDYLPCADKETFRGYRPSSSLIYSDNDGASWTFGGIIPDDTAFEHNEASAVPVDGGRRILMVRRANVPGGDGKMMHYSDDGGESWGPGFSSTVAATRCLQVLETHGDTVLCAAPGLRSRTTGLIHFSRDSGKTWKNKEITKRLFSYSTLSGLDGPYVICIWSRGHHGEVGLGAKVFSVDWLDVE